MSGHDYVSRDLEGAAHLAGLDAEDDRHIDIDPADLNERRVRCTCTYGFDPDCGAHGVGEGEPS